MEYTEALTETCYWLTRTKTKGEIMDYLTRTNGGTSFVGSDQDIFRALHLASALRIYAKTKMLPTRGFSAKMMLDAATRLTGVAYKRGQYELAALDLTDHANNLKLQPRKDG